MILPAGAVCKTSQNLRQLKRQYESLPFDWILTPDLDKIHHLLANRFANFMLQENMEYQCQESDQTDIYFDTATGVGFWHDFPHNVPLEQCYETIKKKYSRRIERLFTEIDRAKDILLFRVNTVRSGSGTDINNIVYAKEVVSDQILEEQFRRIQGLFPGKISVC